MRPAHSFSQVTPMPVDPMLLEILVCPEDKSPVTPADAALVEKLNAAQREGKLMNRVGQPVRETMESGLIRADRTILYPVIEGIPVMLIEEGIPLKDWL